MVRTLGQLAEQPRRRSHGPYPKAPERFCGYCGRHLKRGMGVSDKRVGFRCRRPCTDWPIEIEP